MGPPLVGNYRFEADKRKLAGVLLAISITVCFFPLARLAPFINGKGETADSGIAFAALMGNLIACAMGLLGMTLAWMELVHEYGNANFTFGVSIFEILAFVPYVTDIVMIGKADNTVAVPPLIPGIYNPTADDVWFVKAMGMLGAGTFCLFLFGSYALLVMSLHAYHKNDPYTRNAGYYRTRLTFYSAVMAVAGLAQLMLGAFVLDKYGSGPLPAPVVVAMFLIWFPEISVFVGLVFVLNGLYGMYRGMFKQTDYNFAITMWFQMLCTLILMVGVQTWYAPGDKMAKAVPTLASLTLGVSLMPIFLDYLGRTMPEDITEDYYYSSAQEMQALSNNNKYQMSDGAPMKSIGVEQYVKPQVGEYEEYVPDDEIMGDLHV